MQESAPEFVRSRRLATLQNDTRSVDSLEEASGAKLSADDSRSETHRPGAPNQPPAWASLHTCSSPAAPPSGLVAQSAPDLPPKAATLAIDPVDETDVPEQTAAPLMCDGKQVTTKRTPRAWDSYREMPSVVSWNVPPSVMKLPSQEQPNEAEDNAELPPDDMAQLVEQYNARIVGGDEDEVEAVKDRLTKVLNQVAVSAMDKELRAASLADADVKVAAEAAVRVNGKAPTLEANSSEITGSDAHKEPQLEDKVAKGTPAVEAEKELKGLVALKAQLLDARTIVQGLQTRRAEAEVKLAAMEEAVAGQQRAANQRLWSAAAEGNLPEIRKLVSLGADLSSGDPELFGRNALHFAAYHAQTEAVTELVALGCPINSSSVPLRWTALHYAAQRGHNETVKQLLALGADGLCANDFGKTPGMLARLNGHAALASWLANVTKEPEASLDSIAESLRTLGLSYRASVSQASFELEKQVQPAYARVHSCARVPTRSHCCIC